MKSKSKTSIFRKLRKLKELYRNTWREEFARQYLLSKPSDPIPEAQIQPMTHLGCLHGSQVNDLVTASLTVPLDYQSFLAQLARASQILTQDFATPGQSSDSQSNVEISIPADTAPLVARDILGSEVFLTSVVDSGSATNSQAPDSLICAEDGICTQQANQVASTVPIFVQQPSQPPLDGWNNPFGEAVYNATTGQQCGIGPGLVPCSQAVQNDPRLLPLSEDLYGFQSNAIFSSGITQNLRPEESSLNALISTGFQTPFQNNVLLNSDTTIFNTTFSQGYSSVPLSQEGLLWTLWPLSRDNKSTANQSDATYFNKFTFGTAKNSSFAIGQLAFFSNSREIGCTPFGSVYPSSIDFQSGLSNDIEEGITQLSQVSDGATVGASFFNEVPISVKNQMTGRTNNLGIMPGVQNFNSTLLTTNQQMVALVVIKVTEQVARIPNPSSGVAGDNKFIYVGYDGWSVLRITSTPTNPMSAMTYVTPQSVTGSVAGDNLQVIFPPNFPQSLLYKNKHHY